MLIKTKVKPNDIVTMKMFSGEEVLAKFLSDDGDHYSVAKPIILAPNPSQPGTVVAAPFIATGESVNEIDMLKTHVVAIMKTNKHFSNQYLEITTGLKMAGAVPPINPSEKAK